MKSTNFIFSLLLFLLASCFLHGVEDGPVHQAPHIILKAEDGNVTVPMQHALQANFLKGYLIPF